jgi:hypothetical protein
VNNVLWMKDDEKGLLVGTKGGEWIVRANSLNAALTPTNVKATRATTYGSYENSQPVRTGKDVLFVQRKRKKVRNLNYSYEDDGFDAGDLSVLSSHIGLFGFGQMAFQSEPEGWVWMTRDDGQMPVLTYDRGEQKIGWSRQIFGGYQDAAKLLPAAAESVISIPDPNDARDEVWVIVQRVINGKTERLCRSPLAGVGSRRRPGTGVLCRFRADLRWRGFPDPPAWHWRRCQRQDGRHLHRRRSDFPGGDVDRVISTRWFDYSETDPEDPSKLGAWKTAKAKITGYTSSTIVTATILAAWPDLTLRASGDWRISSTVLGNLWHLEGETIAINAEGATHPGCDGEQRPGDLDRPVAYAVAGLAYRLQAADHAD